MSNHPYFLTVINAVANALLSVSVVHLIIRVFKDPKSRIHKFPVAGKLCKAACAVTLCGTVSNILTMSTPSWTEVLLNAGVSLNFLWLSFYDRATHSPTSKVSRALPKYGSSKRLSLAKSAKKGTPSSRNGRSRPASR
jgi:hypothetical protein